MQVRKLLHELEIQRIAQDVTLKSCCWICTNAQTYDHMSTTGRGRMLHALCMRCTTHDCK